MLGEPHPDAISGLLDSAGPTMRVRLPPSKGGNATAFPPFFRRPTAGRLSASRRRISVPTELAAAVYWRGG